MLTSRRRPSQRIALTLRLIMATGAHDALIATAHQMLGDTLEIESAARIRLADEYDAALCAVVGHPREGGGRTG